MLRIYRSIGPSLVDTLVTFQGVRHTVCGPCFCGFHESGIRESVGLGFTNSYIVSFFLGGGGESWPSLQTEGKLNKANPWNILPNLVAHINHFVFANPIISRTNQICAGW